MSDLKALVLSQVVDVVLSCDNKNELTEYQRVLPILCDVSFAAQASPGEKCFQHTISWNQIKLSIGDQVKGIKLEDLCSDLSLKYITPERLHRIIKMIITATINVTHERCWNRPFYLVGQWESVTPPPPFSLSLKRKEKE